MASQSYCAGSTDQEKQPRALRSGSAQCQCSRQSVEPGHAPFTIPFFTTSGTPDHKFPEDGWPHGKRIGPLRGRSNMCCAKWSRRSPSHSPERSSTVSRAPGGSKSPSAYLRPCRRPQEATSELGRDDSIDVVTRVSSHAFT